MTFTKKVHRANSNGSKGSILPQNVNGPAGEEIEPGDEITVKIIDVEKQSNATESDDNGD